MRKNYSNIYSFNKKILNKSVASLKNGDVIGLPTETVYGLAGNAYSTNSIKKIYRLKKRPNINPLIIHFYDLKMLNENVYMNDDFYKLYEKFCPGPITFILKKKVNSKIRLNALANLNTVAVRFPNHKIVRSILKKIKFPLAMPSANLSSRVSPINAADVAEEFDSKLKLIIDGGKSKVGIESTVIDLVEKPTILRPGIIDIVSIKKVLKSKIETLKKYSVIKSPGLLKRHYSPGIPVILNCTSSSNNDALITFGKKYKFKKNYFNLSVNSDLKEAASNLYRILRKIRNLGYKKIRVVKIPNIGSGIAINDRLKRAAFRK